MSDIESTESTLMCINCGFANKVGARKCAECGESLDEFNSIIVEPKEVDDDMTEEDLENGPQRRPWTRFFARRFDYSWFGLLIAPFIPLNSNQIMQILIYNEILLITWIPIEALFLSKFMTTPGKWLFNITIKTNSDEKLTYKQAFQRGLKVFYKGLFLGIPILTVVSEINYYVQLLERGKTVWDLEGNFIVQHKKIGIKFLLIILAFIMLYVVIFTAKNGYGAL